MVTKLAKTTDKIFVVYGRGLHSSTLQLNLSNSMTRS